ncbi:MAG: glycosyltransferase [Gammaproteobacteria bacterium]|jgi:glycosyltransferase involved in cell wall biosynthesis|nr:glycosyltransferase [Gammaproteobacteria bacterium]
MRILVHDYAGHPFQVQLSRELARRGHEVMHAWCARLQTPRGALSRADDDPRSLTLEGIDLGEEFSKYGLLSRWRQEGRYGKLLAGRLKAFRPDVVISGNTPLRAQAIARREAQRGGAAFVFWVQDVLGVGIGHALRRRLGPAGILPARILQRMERTLWRRSDHVVVISEDFLPYLPERIRRHASSVVHNWAPIGDVPVLDRDNAWSSEQAIPEAPTYVYTGTLGLKHNPRLIAALAEAVGRELDGQVIVTSEGPGAEYLESRGLDNLRVLPFQPFERMPEVLASGDVLLAILEADAAEFAVPSKVLTYLCARRPLLLAVPPANLSRRIVEGAEAGVVVDPEDEKAFVEAGLALGRDEGTRSRLGENARRYAESAFDIQAITNRFEDIFQKLTS